tara:strand:- start:109 stop:540 length:432 start_codon:yes stop_codon:yes gene_type:complete
VWEVIDNERAMDLATRSWKDNLTHSNILDHKRESPSDELVAAAINARSRDNVTAIVLKIRFEKPTSVLYGSCQCAREDEEEYAHEDEEEAVFGGIGSKREFIGSMMGGNDLYSASCCMDNEVVNVYNPLCYIQKRNSCLRSKL